MFTIPDLARVGMLEAEARGKGIDLAVRYSNTSGWYSSYRTAAYPTLGSDLGSML